MPVNLQENGRRFVLETSAREAMLKRLKFFIGTWNMEVIHPHLEPNPITGRTSFEWLHEKYVIQRTHIDKAEFPDNTIVYDCNPDTGQYLLHYFDTRGVTRLYQMSLEDGLWELWRDKADFSPFHFFQRFTGKIDETGKIIESKWEQSNDGMDWKHDFQIVYRRE